MFAKSFSLISAWAFVLAVSLSSCVHAQPDSAGVSVVEVTASYPGANALVVADVIAAPIEQQLNGTQGAVRIESESTSDGKYVAHVHFGPKTDLAAAARLVQNRVALAEPLLPEGVRRTGLTVQVKQLKTDPKKVAIAVVDRAGHGWQALEKASRSVVQRLTAQGVIVKPATFPQDEKLISVVIDNTKCAALGVSVTEASRATVKASAIKSIDMLKKVIVRDKIRLSDVASFQEVTGPNAVFRVNLFPAIRIVGTPPQGKSVAESAAKCIQVAELELTTIEPKGFSVERLGR